MAVRSGKLRTGEGLFSTVVVKPMLARLEARDYRVPRRGVVFRCVLIWRAVAAADVTAFGASAKMKPPSAQGHAFDATCSTWLDRCVDTVPLRLHRLLSDFPLLRLGAAQSLRQLKPIHCRRNKFRRRGMNCASRVVCSGQNILGANSVAFRSDGLRFMLAQTSRVARAVAEQVSAPSS